MMKYFQDDLANGGKVSFQNDAKYLKQNPNFNL